MGPWGSGGGKGPWGSGPQSPADRHRPISRKCCAAARTNLRRVLPGGNLGGKGFALIALGALALWGFSGFFRVEPDELGVVLRFGKEVREVQPGLNYHLPYPIETVLTPKALRVNKIDIGMRVVDDVRRGTTMRDVPEESLMLTGDENIVDVDFSVLWKVKPTGVGEYLFNIQNPEGTVKAVAESAMREVIGRSEIQPILTGARQTIEDGGAGPDAEDARPLRRRHPDQQVQLQKVDPPSQVIDAFRDVQAARADLERAQNEAQTYANRVVPEARGRVAQITQAAEAYQVQTVAEATGQTSRFLKIYEQYKKAPDVTRERMYLETMERVLGGTDKIILDSGHGRAGRGAVSAAQRAAASAQPQPRNQPQSQTGGQPMRTQFRRRRRRRSRRGRADRRLQLAVHRLSDPAGAGGAPRPAGARGQRAGPACQGAVHRQRDRTSTSASSISEAPPQEVIASDQKRLVVDAFARYRIIDPLRFYQALGSIAGANSQLSILLNSALRRVLGEATFTHVVRDERAELMARIREQLDQRGAAYGIQVVDVRIRRADLPEQNSQAVYQRMQTERQREAAEFRAQGAQRGQEIRSRADRDVTVLVAEASRRPSRSAAKATPSATGSSPTRSTRIRTSSPSTARCRPTKPASSRTIRAWCSSRIRISSATSSIRPGRAAAQRRQRRPTRRARRPAS